MFQFSKQDRIHGYPSRSDSEGHWGIWAEAVSSNAKNAQKVIVAKALDGQRYPCPAELVVLEVERGAGQRPRRGQ